MKRVGLAVLFGAIQLGVSVVMGNTDIAIPAGIFGGLGYFAGWARWMQ